MFPTCLCRGIFYKTLSAKHDNPNLRIFCMQNTEVIRSEVLDVLRSRSLSQPSTGNLTDAIFMRKLSLKANVSIVPQLERIATRVKKQMRLRGIKDKRSAVGTL